jgi:hypothetical protein
MRQLQPANARAYRLRFRGYTKGAKRRAQPELFVVFFSVRTVRRIFTEMLICLSQ